jgi:deaminated glutathione amidase
MKKLRIAVSQFPVSEDIRKNVVYISKHIIYASKHKADVIHFPETSLSGYEFEIRALDWNLLQKSLGRIKDLAKQHKISIAVGLHEKQNKDRKPFNSTYLISKTGQILGTYSKTNLYKKEIKRFSAKNNFLVKDINGVRCGFLICYDSCFPRLFEYYRDRNAEVLFLSYGNAGSRHGKNSLNELMEAQLKTRAADNQMYISASNSSARYSRMPSGVVSPDGKFIHLKRHKPGVLIYDYPDKVLGWTYDNSK